MAGGSRQIKINFVGDFSQVKRDAEAAFSRLGVNSDIKDKVLKELKDVQSQLGGHPIKLSVQIDKQSGVDNLTNSLKKTTAAAKEATEATEKLKVGIAQAGQASSTFAERLGFSTTRLAAYLLPAGLIFKLSEGLNVAIAKTRELDSEVNKLTQSFNGNTERASKLADSVLQAATKYGQSGEELLKVANQLSRSGRFSSDNSITKAVESIAKSKFSAGFEDIESSVSDLTASLASFNLTGGDTTRLLDIGTALSSKFAVSAKDLFESIRYGGASFAASGGQIKDYLALFAGVKNITNAPTTTISSGLSEIAAKSLRPDSIKFFDQLTNGAIKNSDGSLKSLGDRLKAIAEATKNFDARALEQVIEKLAGSGQGKFLFPILDDLRKSSEDGGILAQAFSAADDSAGKLSQNATIGLKSIDAQLKSIAPKFSEVFKKLGEDNGIRALAKNFADAAKGMASLLDNTKAFLPIILKIAAIKIGGYALANIGNIRAGALKAASGGHLGGIGGGGGGDGFTISTSGDFVDNSSPVQTKFTTQQLLTQSNNRAARIRRDIQNNIITQDAVRRGNLTTRAEGARKNAIITAGGQIVSNLKDDVNINRGFVISDEQANLKRYKAQAEKIDLTLESGRNRQGQFLSGKDIQSLKNRREQLVDLAAHSIQNIQNPNKDPTVLKTREKLRQWTEEIDKNKAELASLRANWHHLNNTSSTLTTEQKELDNSYKEEIKIRLGIIAQLEQEKADASLLGRARKGAATLRDKAAGFAGSVKAGLLNAAPDLIAIGGSFGLDSAATSFEGKQQAFTDNNGRINSNFESIIQKNIENATSAGRLRSASNTFLGGAIAGGQIGVAVGGIPGAAIGSVIGGVGGGVAGSLLSNANNEAKLNAASTLLLLGGRSRNSAEKNNISRLSNSLIGQTGSIFSEFDNQNKNFGNNGFLTSGLISDSIGHALFNNSIKGSDRGNIRFTNNLDNILRNTEEGTGFNEITRSSVFDKFRENINKNGVGSNPSEINDQYVKSIGEISKSIRKEALANGASSEEANKQVQVFQTSVRILRENGLDKEAQEYANNLKKIKDSFDQTSDGIQSFLLKLSNVNQGIATNTGIKTIKTGLQGQLGEALFGRGGNFQIPQGTTSIIQAQIEQRLRGSSNPSDAFGISAGLTKGLLDPQTQQKFGAVNAASIASRGFITQLLPSLQALNPEQLEASKGKGGLLEKNVQDFFGKLTPTDFGGGDVGKNLLNSVQGRALKATENPESILNNPEQAIQSILGDAGKEFYTNIEEKFKGLQAEIDATSQSYRQFRGVQEKQIELETQRTSVSLGQIERSRSLGATPESIIARINNQLASTAGGTFSGVGGFLGATSKAVGANSFLQGTAGSFDNATKDLLGSFKENADAQLKVTQATDIYKDEIAKAANVTSLLRAKFEELNKVVELNISANQKIGTTSLQGRVRGQIGANVIESVFGSLIGANSPLAGIQNTRDLTRGIQSGKISEAQLAIIAQQVSSSTASPFIQQQLQEAALFGNRPGLGKDRLSGGLDLIQTIGGAGVGLNGQTDVHALFQSLKDFKDTDTSLLSIETEQLDELKKLNQAFRETFADQIKQFEQKNGTSNGSQEVKINADVNVTGFENTGQTQAIHYVLKAVMNKFAGIVGTGSDAGSQILANQIKQATAFLDGPVHKT